MPASKRPAGYSSGGVFVGRSTECRLNGDRPDHVLIKADNLTLLTTLDKSTAIVVVVGARSRDLSSSALVTMPEESLKEQVQKTLADFLREFTFLETARIEADHKPLYSKLAVGKARAVLDTIRGLLSHIKDPGVRAEIHSRADELEAAIDTWCCPRRRASFQS